MQWVTPGQPSIPAAEPTATVIAPRKSSVPEPDEENLSPRMKHRRAQGLRR
jgi:hypothetical protein